eukprot:4338440-Pleurochrysis_carterae.AAC.1
MHASPKIFTHKRRQPAAFCGMTASGSTARARGCSQCASRRCQAALQTRRKPRLKWKSLAVYARRLRVDRLKHSLCLSVLCFEERRVGVVGQVLKHMRNGVEFFHWSEELLRVSTETRAAEQTSVDYSSQKAA